MGSWPVSIPWEGNYHRSTGEPLARVVRRCQPKASPPCMGWGMSCRKPGEERFSEPSAAVVLLSVLLSGFPVGIV